MRVAWICHFSNAEIQSIIHPGIVTGEYAPWITHLARLFETESSVEIHIVAPAENINKYRYISLRNIHYHFYSPDIILFGRKISGLLSINYRTNFFHINYRIKRIIKRINPDLIHLHGAENPNYASAIFQFRRRYPVFISVQGFVSHTSEILSYTMKRRILVEKRILCNFKHFGYRNRKMGETILSFNPDAKLHWHNYPVKAIAQIEAEKKFDIVYFAILSKDKGIEDLLKAISLVKTQLTGITVCIIGNSLPSYLEFLKNMAGQLGINENIYWAGFLESQAEVHVLASSAKISVLPTLHDIIPGTIIESMFLKLPVIAYSVGGIPEINEKEECITLVPKGDINALADKIIRLLSNPEYLIFKKEKAYKRVMEMFNNTKITGDLVKAYREVLHEFKRN